LAKKHDKNQVVTHALSMAFGTFSSRVLAVVREILLLSLFPRAVTDAWIAAFRLPNMFRRLLGEGSLTVSFIPVFVETLHHDEKQARNLVNGVYTCLLLVLSIITTLGTVFPESILRLLLDEKYISQTENFLLTVRMARIMFSFIFLVSLYAYFMGLLNALGHFGLAASAPALFNVAMILSTLCPPGWFPKMGDGLAWGVICGGFLQMIVLVPLLIKKGFFPKISWDILQIFKNSDVQKVFKNMLPGLFGLGLLQVTTVLNQNFASSLGEGAITYIYSADRLLELPLSLVSVSLGVALLPTLSSLWARGEKEKMSETLSYYMGLNLYVVLAASLGLYFLAKPIIEVLFFHGHFTSQDVEATATVLRIWALIMIPTSLVRVFVPSYFAVKNTWFPAVVSLVCLIVHWFVAPLLMASYGLSGLNYSSLISSSLNILLLFSFYPFLVHHFPAAKLFKTVVRYVGPGLGMGGILFLYSGYESTILEAVSISMQNHSEILMMKSSLMLKGFRIILLSAAILTSALVYFAVSSWLQIEEYQKTFGRLLGKVLKRMA
jgi:putative peptidoglycan lipid II flippase